MHPVAGDGAKVALDLTKVSRPHLDLIAHTFLIYVYRLILHLYQYYQIKDITLEVKCGHPPYPFFPPKSEHSRAKSCPYQQFLYLTAGEELFKSSGLEFLLVNGWKIFIHCIKLFPINLIPLPS